MLRRRILPLAVFLARRTHTKPRAGAPTPEEYKQYRLDSLQQLNVSPYPRFRVSPSLLSCGEFNAKFHEQFEKGEWKREEHYVLTGRVTSRRDASRKLVFLDIQRGSDRTQIIVKKNEYESEDGYKSIVASVREGDIVEAAGYPGRSPAGELSLVARSLTLLAPCLHRIPKGQGLLDPETRFRARYLDLIANNETIHIFRKRAEAVQYIRNYLVSRGFLEVETPILGAQAGGANARPFKTTSNALGLDMFLRVAPELYLKQLVIGGIDKVFEMGKQFRNEGIDTTHNPEFTTCEFYQAYTDLESVMDMTEDLLRGLVFTLQGTYQIPYTVHGPNGEMQTIEIDFEKPFKRVDVLEALERSFGKVPDLEDPASTAALLTICKTHNIRVSQPHTVARILDKMISTSIEPNCTQPTFLLNHPVALSPLAKRSSPTSPTTSRFELFIASKELVNAYEELNEPSEQRQRFMEQARDREVGDLEAQVADEGFCEALEYGLPPTTGWGLGVDRLCMLLVGVRRIREVIAFPILGHGEKNA
ncbi:lysine-tRNA ligase [Spizellomyces punctatus DAOM BR117]|uniref:Lysine--tRNA ligase n=1 Tax=Spizellomyces punctatus (strain DAOM BR117) TaxID=645134 RepID=A0A0L0HKA9_SPIPD|nr:lysine-tRNA ligase [Spizellomyces punctatus DAOM BR117]KND01896.1 lysine-tRNA ligase [Spizellomyces punctatus DAOM BR117]|eukprot:XP_016609935.1 lysine-tRNA ligase [Spizellomyces punctatus DAOM BR117]